jgi:hypothetical protein
VKEFEGKWRLGDLEMGLKEISGISLTGIVGFSTDING